MSESFTITFEPYSVQTLIPEIEDALKNLERNPDEVEDEEPSPELIVSTNGAEEEIENFLWEALQQIQKSATSDEGDFDNNK
jgi:hypothetical protein